MQTTHLTPADDFQGELDKLSGGQRLVLKGEFNGDYDVPASAEGSEIVFDDAVIDGRDEWPKGALDMHNGGKGYAESSLFTVKASNCRVLGTGLVKNSRGSGWRLNAARGSVIDGLNVDNVRWQGFRVDAGKGHTVRNIVATRAGMFNPTDRSATESNWPNAGTVKDGQECLFENVRIGESWCEGFGSSGEGITLRNFQIWNCFSAGLYLNRSGKTTIENLLIWHDGKSFRRGGSQPNGLIFGLEKADKQAHRDPTHDVDIKNAVVINMGPGLSFRSQNDDEGFTDINVSDSTFYESREKGKPSTAIYFNAKIFYHGVAVVDNLFVQTVGARSNMKVPPVDLDPNTWATVAANAPLPKALSIYTGDLNDYIGADGAKWWDTRITRKRWVEEGGPVDPPPIDPPDPVDPVLDQEELRALILELEVWLGRVKVAVG